MHEEPIDKYSYVISADPGVVNYAVAIYKRRKSGRFRCLTGFHTEFAMDSLKPSDFKTQAILFEESWIGLLEYYTKPDINTREKCLIVIERFQNRGVKASAAELVTTMNTLVYSVACSFGYDFRLYTAAQWKNRFKQKFGKSALELTYAKADSLGITDHVIDASLLGRYAIDKFDKFKITTKFYERLKQKVENG